MRVAELLHDRNAPLGCHIGVMKRIVGGKSGNSDGKLSRAFKNPPSLQSGAATQGHAKSPNGAI
jgi:hypothetical protein